MRRLLMQWGRRVGVGCMLFTLVGCSYAPQEWLGRQLSGLDCRQDKLDAQGRCVIAR